MAAATMHSACCHCQSFIGTVSGVVSDSCAIFGRVLSGRKHKKTLNLMLFIQAPTSAATLPYPTCILRTANSNCGRFRVF